MDQKFDDPVSALSISLEENLLLHDIGAEIFAPFIIERLNAGGTADSAELNVMISKAGESARIIVVQLNWQPRSAFHKSFVVQQRVMTEWEALGLACGLIPSLLDLRVLSVALEGERFDYRIGNDFGEWGLEVSGSLSESADDLRERHRRKIAQLRESPTQLSGYVFVVGFTLREVMISFHLPLMEKFQ